MSEKVYGHKDMFATFSFVFTGLAVLIGINVGVFYIIVRHPQMLWWFVLWLAVLCRVLRRMWRIQKYLWYVFDDDAITIHVPGGKEFVLPRKDITNQERIECLSWFSGRWISYIPRKHELYFTTSSSHILKISMADGRTIFISPKVWPGE